MTSSYSDNGNIENNFSGKSIIAAATSTNSTIPEGIGIDWSDAITSGSNVGFDAINRSFGIPVGTSFNIDPVVIATVNVSLAPSNNDYAEDGRRIIRVQISSLSKQYAFYYDGGNIVY